MSVQFGRGGLERKPLRDRQRRVSFPAQPDRRAHFFGAEECSSGKHWNTDRCVVLGNVPVRLQIGQIDAPGPDAGLVGVGIVILTIVDQFGFGSPAKDSHGFRIYRAHKWAVGCVLAEAGACRFVTLTVIGFPFLQC